ncbi:hypothetical protein BDM02DRAFT_3127169 [Thelephora ganbajun]|uniref:Uncharacterized protein n=1 Tax=Thelephora ganbajun TaxID=370292 RepID=A0ACB6ZNU5_THEGA|nr:hypothetical protein BDM02DRAFT_3127169 [Thelephora ganbajun]
MVSGPQRRVTTVHDRAALRVHPDGTRVSSRESRHATRDLRGNRIAANAGGTGNVKKRKRETLSDDGTKHLEEFDIGTDEYQPPQSQPSSTDSCAGEAEDESEGEGRRRKRQKKDPRTVKRTQFYQDFDFILGGKNGAETAPASNDLLLPSSDLLKCLHHFSAKYYSGKGQLINASRIARQKKKAKMVSNPGSRSSSWSTADSISGEESDNNGTDVAPASFAPLQTPKQKGRQGANLVKDMYKMFDGSALVALGKHSIIAVTLDWGLDFEGDPEQELGSEDGDEDDEEDD